MSRRPDPTWNTDERRNARIRELRDQRGGPGRHRRPLQPLVLLAWFSGVTVLAGLLLFGGFVLLAPSLMTWVEEHPGTIDNGLVRDFVV